MYCGQAGHFDHSSPAQSDQLSLLIDKKIWWSTKIGRGWSGTPIFPDCGLDVLPVPYYPVNKRVGGLWVALGCYINFLMVDSKIFMRTFDNKVEDDNALARFEEIFGSGNVIPMPSKDVAMCGGVLNCLSWEINSWLEPGDPAHIGLLAKNLFN